MLEKPPGTDQRLLCFLCREIPTTKENKQQALADSRAQYKHYLLWCLDSFCSLIRFAGDIRRGILLPRLFLFIPLRGRPTKVKSGDNVLLADTALEEIIFIECSIGLCFPSIH